MIERIEFLRAVLRDSSRRWLFDAGSRKGPSLFFLSFALPFGRTKMLPAD